MKGNILYDTEIHFRPSGCIPRSLKNQEWIAAVMNVVMNFYISLLDNLFSETFVYLCSMVNVYGL